MLKYSFEWLWSITEKIINVSFNQLAPKELDWSGKREKSGIFTKPTNFQDGNTSVKNNSPGQ